MGKLRNLRIAVRAATAVPLPALFGHARRRLRARIVPHIADRFAAGIARDAAALPLPAALPSEPARRAAATVAMFFAAKHTKNVPQCFDGRFTFLNRPHDFGSVAAIDWGIDMDGGRYQLWRANLAFMGYACAAIDADPGRGLRFAADLIRGFEAAARFDRPGVFTDLWNAYPVSQRLLAFCAALIRLPTEFREDPDRAVIVRFVRFNVAYLLRSLETELGFNHLERNLSALALYALATGVVPPRVKAAILANFDHILGETIGADGVQLERSPMYQGLTIQSLRVLRELDFWTPEQAALIAHKLDLAEQALAAMTLGDDRPSMMNDGWFDEAPRPSAILGAYPRPGFVALRDAGYVRLAAGDAVALFDAGPIGPAHNPGHGHPDFLSVELSLGEERLLVDPGTSGYSADAGRGRDRLWERHNGPAIVGATPVEFLGSFKVGRRAAAILTHAEDRSDAQHASGSLAFPGVTVSREVVLRSGGLSLIDRWEQGSGDRRTCFLIPADWRLAMSGESGVTLAKGGRAVRVAVADATLEIAADTWSCRYNLSEPAHALLVRPLAATATTTIDWS